MDAVTLVGVVTVGVLFLHELHFFLTPSRAYKVYHTMLGPILPYSTVSSSTCSLGKSFRCTMNLYEGCCTSYSTWHSCGHGSTQRHGGRPRLLVTLAPLLVPFPSLMQMSVDTTRGSMLPIHFDITFPAMPCPGREGRRSMERQNEKPFSLKTLFLMPKDFVRCADHPGTREYTGH